MPLSTSEWFNVWALIYLCPFWPTANGFQIIGHLDMEGCLCGCSSGVHTLSHVFAFTWGIWSPWTTWWLPRINARTVFLHERTVTQDWPGYTSVYVKRVIVILSAFLWLILSGQRMSLFVMAKGVHSASKVSSTYTPARALYLDSCAGIGNLPDKMFSLPNMPTLLSNAALFLHCGFCAMLSTYFNRSSATVSLE